MGPPAGFQLFDEPTYPVVAEFPAVAPGDYVALAFIDVDGSGIMGPNEGDVETTVDVTLPTHPLWTFIRWQRWRRRPRSDANASAERAKRCANRIHG